MFLPDIGCKTRLEKKIKNISMVHVSIRILDVNQLFCNANQFANIALPRRKTFFEKL